MVENALNIKPIDKLENNIRLSLSESPYGMSNEAKESIMDEIKNVSNYPDTNAANLCNKISQLYGISSNMVFCTNGIDELLLISTLAFIHPEKYGLTTKSTFKGFCSAIKFAGGKCLFVDLEGYNVSIKKVIDSLNKDVDLIYICNPHNPTGTIISKSDIELLLDYAKKYEVIVIMDEAYAEYVNSNLYISSLAYIKKNDPVIVTRTFSKIYGLAGLRCGYAIAQPYLIDKMKQVKKTLPYNVNRLAQKAALASLNCSSFINRVKKSNEQVKSWMYEQLDKLAIDYVKSETNFVLIKVPVSSKLFCEKIYFHYGILLRDAEEFGFPQHIRVSLGTYETMVYVMDCFEKVLYDLKI